MKPINKAAIIILAAIIIGGYGYLAYNSHITRLQEEITPVFVFIEFCEQGAQEIPRVRAVSGINVTMPGMYKWINECCVISYNETEALVGECPEGSPGEGEFWRLTVGG